MAVNVSDVSSLCAQLLNASSTSYGTIDDPIHPSQEFTDAANLVGGQIINTILATAGHMDRNSLVSTITVTNGQAITQPIVGGVMISGKPGKPASPGLVQRMLYNPNNAPANLVNGFYCIQGLTISYTGASATIDVLAYTPGSPLAALRYEYALAVAYGVLSLVQVFEGTEVSAGGHWAGLFQACLQIITQSKTNFPTPTEFINQKG